MALTVVRLEKALPLFMLVRWVALVSLRMLDLIEGETANGRSTCSTTSAPSPVRMKGSGPMLGRMDCSRELSFSFSCAGLSEANPDKPERDDFDLMDLRKCMLLRSRSCFSAGAERIGRAGEGGAIVLPSWNLVKVGGGTAGWVERPNNPASPLRVLFALDLESSFRGRGGPEKDEGMAVE